MAGLLDILGGNFGTDDPRQAAYLALASGLLSGRGNFGQVAGQALQGAQGTFQEARKAQQQAMLTKMQMEEMQRKAQAAQRESAEAARLQNILTEAFSPVGGGEAASASGGPTPAGVMMMNKPRAVDYQKLIARGVPPELAEALANAPNLGRPEVARTIEAAGADGRPVTQQYDKFGGAVGGALPKAVEKKLANLGGASQAYDPYALIHGQQLQHTMTPDGKDASARGWARLNFDKTKDTRETSDPGKYTQVVIDPNLGPIVVDRKTKKWTPVVSATTGERIPGKNITDAKTLANQLEVGIKAARELIPKATGSGFGRGIDAVTGFVGYDTEGDDAAAQLETLGGWMTANVPRMQGPQSDKDTLLYKQMAAQVGDRTKTRASRLKALDTLEQLQKKYVELSTESNDAPSGVDAAVWNAMTPAEKALWKKP